MVEYSGVLQCGGQYGVLQCSVWSVVGGVVLYGTGSCYMYLISRNIF